MRNHHLQRSTKKRNRTKKIHRGGEFIPKHLTRRKKYRRRIKKKQWMPINIKKNRNIKIYPMEPQNREIIDKKFKDLHQQKIIQ